MSKAVALNETEMSEYEQLRLKNIERNRNMLKSLGFDSREVKSSTSKPSPSSGKKRSRQQQTQRKEGLESSAIPSELLRRSARAAKLPAPDYKEPQATFHDTYQNAVSNKR